MLGYRAYRLELVRTASSGGHDADGFPVADVERVESMACHLVPRSHSSVVYVDGKSWNYNFVVYLDVDCPSFEAGDRVRFFGPDGVELKCGKGFEVKQFFRYQTYAKLWV